MTDHELLIAISAILDEKLKSLSEQLKSVALVQENEILPRLQNIESSCMSAYQRYQQETKADNWICDLYSRIDAEQVIAGVQMNKYREEISWSYRLGYLDRSEYEDLLEYLEICTEEKQNAYEHTCQVRLAQIAYEQDELRKSIEYRADVINLFCKGIKYRHGCYQIKYATLEEIEKAEREQYNTVEV